MANAFVDRLDRPGRVPGSWLGVVADSGQVARVAGAAGVDFLLALSAGVYRNHGVNAIAAFLPFQNTNDLTEALARDRILPAAGSTPVVAGVLAGDPTDSTPARLARLRAAGAWGITNYPSITMLDGSFRGVFEGAGCDVDAEIALLTEAHALGLATVAFVGTEPEIVARFAAAPVDAMILTAGPTRSLHDIHEQRDRLQHAIRRLSASLEAARRVDPRIPCLVFGGPITQPEDLEQVVRQASFDGFVGGSVIGRDPIEGSVSSAIHRFKQALSPSDAGTHGGLGPMIGTSPAMRSLYRLIRRSATCDLNICIEGESGVGKELVATQIHRLSRRSHGALVTLNCGAIPDTLLESELFGHERGAFTGADHRRLGKFELAHDGTLFLDEVSDLSPRAQVALLRAIQQREITRVGGDRSIPVDIRILSASNQPLAGLVDAGRFRADLYYRLNNLTIRVPPLRERLDDLPALVAPVLATLRAQMSRELVDLTPSFHERLRQHAWPGNLRELQHILAQAALLEDGPLLTGRYFVPSIASSPASASRLASADRLTNPASQLRAERVRKIEQALLDARGNKSRAAERLGISRKTLYAWMASLEAGEQP